MLVDSSVWVSFLRGEAAAEVDVLASALECGDPIWLAPPILQEVLQGADNPERFARWDRVMGDLPMLVERDVTPRSAIDCLIAVHAIGGNMPLLHRDRDFVAIAGVEPKLMLLPTEAGKGRLVHDA